MASSSRMWTAFCGYRPIKEDHKTENELSAVPQGPQPRISAIITVAVIFFCWMMENPVLNPVRCTYIPAGIFRCPDTNPIFSSISLGAVRHMNIYWSAFCMSYGIQNVFWILQSLWKKLKIWGRLFQKAFSCPMSFVFVREKVKHSCRIVLTKELHKTSREKRIASPGW